MITLVFDVLTFYVHACVQRVSVLRRHVCVQCVNVLFRHVCYMN